MNEPNPEAKRPRVQERLWTIAEKLGFTETAEMKEIRAGLHGESQPLESTLTIFDWLNAGYQHVKEKQNPENPQLQTGLDIASAAIYSDLEMRDEAKLILVSVFDEAEEAGDKRLAAQVSTILFSDFDYTPGEEPGET